MTFNITWFNRYWLNRNWLNKNWLNKYWIVTVITACVLCGHSVAYAKSLKDLEYGVILYEYYQQDYFSALIEYEYSVSLGSISHNDYAAEVLKGGMMLSYGLADDSEKIFNNLLNDEAEEGVRNRAWFYLAKMYYQRGELVKASDALNKVRGSLPLDIQPQYHYLSMLINMDGHHLDVVQEYLQSSPRRTELHPFLIFNLAMNQVEAGDLYNASVNLNQVAAYSESGDGEAVVVLSDRAKHALALLAIKQNELPEAWSHLKTIRTNGLYSNRALLTYGWNAIEMKKYEEAIPALKILADRSITLPEVQEAKVLLAHLYELQGDKRGALKEYIMAVKEYEKGVAAVVDTRLAIAQTDVPEEFVSNLEAVMEDSDWYGTQPSVDYLNLTPFLLDLLSSHSFQESLRELGDLYAIRKNLRHWKTQKDQHNLVLNNKALNWSTTQIRQKIKSKADRYMQLHDQSLELRLHTQTLGLNDQTRFESILNVTGETLSSVNNNIQLLGDVNTPYVQPADYRVKANKVHERAGNELKKTNKYILRLEEVVRAMVSKELDQHDERMKYYWAQARLAKARLYDDTLNTLEASHRNEDNNKPDNDKSLKTRMVQVAQ